MANSNEIVNEIVKGETVKQCQQEEAGISLRRMTIKEICDEARNELKTIERRLRNALEHPTLHYEEQAYPGQHSEIGAQLTLAVRHVEDARMRCGKVLQFSGDGVSIHDKSQQA